MSLIGSPTAAGTIRFPRCYLVVNGSQIPCLAAQVTRNSERTSDTFSARLSVTQSAQYGMDLAAWADFQPDGDASIVFSTAPGGGDAVTMITGAIDIPVINWQSMTVGVQGRDKGSSLTEKRRSQKFQNQQSSDIVSSIAQDHGLDVAAIPGSGFAGKIWDQDTVHMVINRSDFEVLNDLAEREGFRWYVDGTTLYFEPTEQDNGAYQVFWQPPTPDSYASANAMDLRTFRNMTAAKSHEVNVSAWHHKDKKQYNAKATSPGVGSDSVIFEHHHNGRNQDQVETLANSRLKNAIRHDCNVAVKLPGDLGIDVRQKLQLSGTGTVYDQSYDIDSIVFAMSWESGFTMDITARGPKDGRDSLSTTDANNLSTDGTSGYFLSLLGHR